MKKFFENKTNIILSVVLVVLVGAGVALGILFFKEPEVKAVDFSNMSEQEIIDWATENNVIDKFEFKHEYDANVKEGGIVYYSLKEGEAITDKVLIIISDGRDTSSFLEIPITQDTTKDTLDEWFKENGFTNVTYEEVDSAEYTAGHVISCEPTKADPGDKVVVKIAAGQLVEVPDFSFYSDAEITKWSKTNDVKIVYKEEVSKTVKKGNFISQSITAGKSAAVGSTITITISSGDGTSTDKTVYIDPYKYLGYSETDFKKALNDLGFKNLKKLDAAFSSKQKKDTICYYLPDGNQKTTSEISYKLSLGAFDVSTFNGKTKAEGETLIASAKSIGGAETLKVTETDTTDTTKQGKLYDCTLSSKTVTCKLGKTSSTGSNETATIPTNLYGNSVTEATFKSKLSELGFTNLQKSNIYSSGTSGTVRAYDPDGKQAKSTLIKYAVSVGSFKASDYNGLTAAKAQEKVDALKADVASITLVKNETVTTAHTAGTVYDCSLSSSSYFSQTITCKLAKGSSTSTEEKVTLTNYVGQDNPCGSNSSCTLNNINFTISKENSLTVANGKVISQSVSAGEVAKGTNVTLMVSLGKAKKTIVEFETLESWYSKSSYNDTYSAIKSYFDNLGFTNVTYNKVTASVSVGTLVSVSVNGNTDYTGGDYDIDVPIVVNICNSET